MLIDKESLTHQGDVSIFCQFFDTFQYRVEEIDISGHIPC